jgi:hypothetical protein
MLAFYDRLDGSISRFSSDVTGAGGCEDRISGA